MPRRKQAETEEATPATAEEATPEASDPKAETWPREVMVQGPAYGCAHPILGEFKPGHKPRRVTLTEAQHEHVSGRSQPFTLTEIEDQDG